MVAKDSAFTCPEVKKEEFVFIAGGQIGPVRDCVTKTLKSNPGKEIHLFFGANTKSDLNGAEELQHLSEFSNDFHMVTSLNSPSPKWKGEVGLITDVVREQLEPERIKKCFLYGPQTMIKETKRTLKDMGVPEEEIYHDSFQRDY